MRNALITRRRFLMSACQGSPHLWIFGDHSFRSDFYG